MNFQADSGDFLSHYPRGLRLLLLILTLLMKNLKRGKK
jgi:hypothetical protein